MEDPTVIAPRCARAAATVALPPAILVLGMHRSGTSCVAGMLQASGVASAGPSVRNWDNARGHHESLALVRLNETVLARSGGNWLTAPAELCWTSADERERERLLGTAIDGRAPLLKDPRTLLCLRFWRAAQIPFHVLGVVRHPAAAARSLAGWRGLPVAQGLALWMAHNGALLADQARHGYPLIDFEGSKAEVVAALEQACRRFGLAHDRERLARAYDERLVHHDGGEAAEIAGMEEAQALYDELAARAGARLPRPARRPMPRAAIADFERELAAGNRAGALAAARAALAGTEAAEAVVVPVVAALSRARAFAEARALLAGAAPALERELFDLLVGKVLLAGGDARGAVEHLASACAAPNAFYQARRLLPHALRAAGRKGDARRALLEAAERALYPHAPLAQLAEWAWSDGEPRTALAHMAAAIAAAPRHRRGRMRARRAEWLALSGAHDEAEAELQAALEEDPHYPRARRELERLQKSVDRRA
jgi:hypothetical protein